VNWMPLSMRMMALYPYSCAWIGWPE
jgi:hypothetical protein